MNSDTERELYVETTKKRKRDVLEDRQSNKSRKLSTVEKDCNTSQLSDQGSYSSSEERSSVDSDDGQPTLCDQEEDLEVLGQLVTAHPQLLLDESVSKDETGFVRSRTPSENDNEGTSSHFDPNEQHEIFASQLLSYSANGSQESCGSSLRTPSFNRDDFVAHEVSPDGAYGSETREEVDDIVQLLQVSPDVHPNFPVFALNQPDDDSSNDLLTSETVQRSSETIYYPSSDGDEEAIIVDRQDLTARRQLNFDENRYEE